MKKIVLLIIFFGLMVMPTVAQESITFQGVQYSAEEDGIRFWVDLSLDGYAERDLRVLLWFEDTETEELIRNADADDIYINSKNTLYIENSVRPCCESTMYSNKSIELYIPYDQFPAGDYSYYLFPTIYDDNGYVDGKRFRDIIIPYRAPIDKQYDVDALRYTYVDNGIWFYVDMMIKDHSNEPLKVIIWFKDQATGEYVRNPTASPDVRNRTNTLFLEKIIYPESDEASYSGNDLAFSISYYEFPDELTNYILEVSVYDNDYNYLHGQDMTQTVFSTNDHPFPESGVLIKNLDVDFDGSGVILHVDLMTENLTGDDYFVYAFFNYYNDDYIQNAIPIEDYYQIESGAIATNQNLNICCNERQTFNDIELFVPFNTFPVGSYSYYPTIAVYLDGDQTPLASRAFTGYELEVLGDDAPVGYIVNYEIDSVFVRQTFNSGSYSTGPSDQLMILYSLSQLDSENTILSGDQSIWVEHVGAYNNYLGDGQRLLVDMRADNRLAMRLEYVDVVDLDGYKEARDALKSGRRLASRAARSLTPRLFKIAAGAALRYTNGFLIIFDIISLFEEDQQIDTYERIFTPAELYQMYEATGAISDQHWHHEQFIVREPGTDFGHNYEMDVVFSLYGYFGHRLVEP